MTSAPTARKKRWKNLAAPSHLQRPPQKTVEVESKKQGDDGRDEDAGQRGGGDVAGREVEEGIEQQQDHGPERDQDGRGNPT